MAQGQENTIQGLLGDAEVKNRRLLIKRLRAYSKQPICSSVPLEEARWKEAMAQAAALLGKI